MNFILVIWTGIALIVVAYLSLQIVLGTLRKQVPGKALTHQSNVRVLIPAHNEEMVIGKTLENILAQLTENEHVTVIADNCSDATEEIATSMGVEVLKRNDTNHRGKGYALDYGLKKISQNPPDIVVFIDADCELKPGALNCLVSTAEQEDRPVQARYLMYPPDGADILQKVSAFAVQIKNDIRLAGTNCLGVPCHLTGSGMAFPWRVIESRNLASGNIVEDMQLGVDCVKSENYPLFCREAHVISSLPKSTEDMIEQRTRWEHGHLNTIFCNAPKLFIHGLRKLDLRCIGFALDLSIPPLTLLLIILWANIMFSGLWLVMGLGAWPAYISFLAFLVLMISLSLAWWKHGRKTLPPQSMKALPGYLVRKLKLYLAYPIRRQTDWIRTNRN